MPRIRSVKPDFWNDEKIGQESESIMLTFIGTWNFADDYGVVKANPLWLKNQIFPYKDKLRIDVFSTWLARLSELEAVILFTLKGESFYYIRTFRKHQRVEKPSKARNCNEEELILILNEKGYFISVDGEFIRQSGSSRGGVGEQSPPDKEGDKEKEVEGGKGGDPPKHTQIEIDLFKSFQVWVKDKAPNVSKMKEPFTIDEYLKLRIKFSKEQVSSLILKMGNYKPLLSKNISSYRTFLNWCERDYDNAKTELAQSGPTPTETKAQRILNEVN